MLRGLATCASAACADIGVLPRTGLVRFGGPASTDRTGLVRSDGPASRVMGGASRKFAPVWADWARLGQAGGYRLLALAAVS